MPIPFQLNPEIDAIAVTGCFVADDGKIARISGRVGAPIDFTVLIQVGEFDLSRSGHLVERLQERLLGVRVDVFLIAEKTFYAVAPDFAQLLAFVVIAQCRPSG